jgi:uncharacterized protein (TIGR02147 family)
MKSIFSYLNYRQYLREYQEDRKEMDKGYTFRFMAQQMGFSSSNYLMLVMQGKRNLGQDSVEKVVKGLGLGKKEGEYFSYLVQFDQAKSSVKKNHFFTLIASFRKKSTIVRIHENKFNYYDNWYNPVLREVVKYKAAGTDAKEIAQLIEPPILPKHVKKSLRLLQDLGMIKVDKSGRWTQTTDLLETEPEIHSLAVRNFHKKMGELGKEAVERFDAQSREVSSLTVRISEQGFKTMKKRIQDFREELLRLVKDEPDDDRVYQLNFQFFPVSKYPLEKES